MKAAALAIGAVSILVVGIMFAIPGKKGNQAAKPSEAIPASLVTIMKAQRHFRENGGAGVGRREYWRSDVAGLYANKGSDGVPMRLILPGLAAADASPTSDFSSIAKKAPYLGYWFRSIRFSDEKTPDPSRFCVCAYPASYGTETSYLFVMNQDGTVYCKDTGRAATPEYYPDNPVQDGWQAIPR